MTYQFGSDYLSKTLIPAMNSAVLGSELQGNTAAISKFSKAGSTSSYSFGLYQFDVDKNAAARTFLSSIGFSDAQITLLRQTTALAPAQRDALSNQLQTALNVPANAVKLQLFTEAWASGLASQLQDVLNNLAGSGAVGQAIANQIYSSTALQVQLIDYGNQFHLDLNGRMTSWLRAPRKTFPVLPLSWRPDFGLIPMIRYSLFQPRTRSELQRAWRHVAGVVLTPMSVRNVGSGAQHNHQIKMIGAVSAFREICLSRNR